LGKDFYAVNDGSQTPRIGIMRNTIHTTGEKIQQPNLRLVAWEVTRRCNLGCLHCRASAVNKFDEEELSTKESFLLMDEITKLSSPILILTGGEPLLRKDIFKVASYGVDKGLRVVMALNGTLITPKVASQIRETGIKRISVSLDGASAKIHDNMRRVNGAFADAIRGIKWAKATGLELQINTTITKQNYTQINEIINLAIKLGAVACHFFFLVPTGRAKKMSGKELIGTEYENILNQLYEENKKNSMEIKAVCAPHYLRIRHQKKAKTPSVLTKACLAGTSFCFISYKGDIFPCGYLDVKCGNIKRQNFKDIWENSPVFNALRDDSRYKGKCGRCEYLKICGGCRARAYAKTGDYLAEEPNCSYEPMILG